METHENGAMLGDMEEGVAKEKYLTRRVALAGALRVCRDSASSEIGVASPREEVID